MVRRDLFDGRRLGVTVDVDGSKVDTERRILGCRCSDILDDSLPY